MTLHQQIRKMEHKSLIIKLSQNERYCSEYKKVKNEKEFVETSSNKCLS